MKNSNIFFIIILLILTTFSSYGQNSTYTIEGVVSFKGEGTAYIFLVNEKTLEGKGLKKTVKHLSVKELSERRFSFTFKDIPAGEYGIKCFIDKNGNGVLDKGLFGPVEPWGMSWIDGKPFGQPKFHQMSFRLYSDKQINLLVD